MGDENRNLQRLQRQFILGSALILPLAPFLYLQGQVTRWKVGILPDAGGESFGIAGRGDGLARLFVIGESTVAGLGARDHERALAGQFAHHLHSHIGRPVEWNVLGKNGVTARRTIDELVPHMPDEDYDYILVGLGGNDVMKLSSPYKWRRDMLELLGILRDRNPRAVIFITNCPMIIYSPIMPEPVKSILWRLSQMHDANAREFIRDLEGVFYYPQPADVPLEGFFADGLHPSEQGYRDWSAAMIRYFSENHEW